MLIMHNHLFPSYVAQDPSPGNAATQSVVGRYSHCNYSNWYNSTGACGCVTLHHVKWVVEINYHNSLASSRDKQLLLFSSVSPWFPVASSAAPMMQDIHPVHFMTFSLGVKNKALGHTCSTTVESSP